MNKKYEALCQFDVKGEQKMIVFIERYLPIEGTSFHYWATVMNTDETPVTFESKNEAESWLNDRDFAVDNKEFRLFALGVN